MKKLLIISIGLLLLICSCKNQDKESTTPPEEKSQTYTGPIIDMHIHAYGEGNPMFGMTHPPTLRGKTYEGVKSAAEQKIKTIEKFEKYNIVKAVVTNGQLWKDKEENRILIGRTDREIDSLKKQYGKNKLHVIGELAPFYGGIKANHPSLKPYYELAQSLSIPIGFHIFPGGPNNGIHFMPQMLGGMRASNANPLQLDEILANYPDLKLYIMHGGWPYTEDVKALLYMHRNLYVDIAVLNWVLPQKEFEDYVKTLVNAGFGNRILFGTDQMVWPDTIDDAVASVNALDFLTLEQKEDIFYDNAAGFIGLSEEEIKKDKNQ